MKTFNDYDFSPQIMRALERLNFTSPTEVQALTLPFLLAGRDALVTAQTGSGKTAAFAIPILKRMLDESNSGEAKPNEEGFLATNMTAVERRKTNRAKIARVKRALIIAPTRELAEQICDVIDDLTWSARRFRISLIIGGAGYGRQLSELRDEPAFVVGTPGRLNDHLKSGALDLKDFGYLVIDEADRLLDMGFEPQVEQIVSRFPTERQTMMFSATLQADVRKMVQRYLRNPERVAVGEENRPVEKIKQDLIEVSEGDKRNRLIAEIDKIAGTIIIFTRTRSRANALAKVMSDIGHQAEALHGDLSQNQRRRAVESFRAERTRILVATDIAARGLDINHIKHVINYDLPMVPEDYIHRIGRTARNGAEGHSLSLVTPQEKSLWVRILKLTGQPIPDSFAFARRPKDQGKSGGARARANTSFFSKDGGKKKRSHSSLPFKRSEPRSEQRSERPRGASEGPAARAGSVGGGGHSGRPTGSRPVARAGAGRPVAAAGGGRPGAGRPGAGRPPQARAAAGKKAGGFVHRGCP